MPYKIAMFVKIIGWMRAMIVELVPEIGILAKNVVYVEIIGKIRTMIVVPVLEIGI